MNKKAKQITAVGLLVGTGAVWVPQLLSATSKPSHHLTEEISASGEPMEAAEAGGGSEAGAGVDWNEPPAGGDDVAPSVPSVPQDGGSDALDSILARDDATDSAAGQAGETGDLVEDLERSLRATDTLVGDNPETSLRALIQAMQEGNRAAEPGEVSGTTTPRPSAFATSAELASFAAENPLTGIVYGENDAVAMVGHRVVRSGDRIDGGRVLVAEVGRGWVRLARGAEEIVLDLPPFTARARSVVSDGGEGDGEGGGGGGASEETGQTGEGIALDEYGFEELVGEGQ